MRILGLDPGETTGFAFIETHKGKVSAVSYGIVPRLAPGISGLVKSVEEWLEWFAATFQIRTSGNDVVFEEYIKCYKLPTRKESHEVRGIIRRWCAVHKPVDSFAYTPEEVRSQLGLPLKGAVKRFAAAFVERVLGYKPCGPDHITDAFAVALAHALRTGAWHGTLRSPLAELAHAIRIPNESTVRPSMNVPSQMTAAEYQELLRSGLLK